MQELKNGLFSLSDFEFKDNEINKDLKNLLELKNNLIIKDNDKVILNKDVAFYSYNYYRQYIRVNIKEYLLKSDKKIRFKDFKENCIINLKENINYEINKFIYDYLSDKLKSFLILINSSLSIEKYHNNSNLYSKELKEFFGLCADISYYLKIQLFYYLLSNKISFDFEIKRNSLYLTLNNYKKDIEEINKDISYSLEIIEKLKEYFHNLNIKISYEVK